jgi:hypothetical protein
MSADIPFLSFKVVSMARLSLWPSREGKSPESKKRSRRRWAPLAGLALAPLMLLATQGTASAQTWCFYAGGGQPDLKGDTTWAQGTQRAANTWQDWVWRGDTFRCPTNVPGCSYAWGQTKTSGWSWSVGVSVNIPNAGSITPNYGRNGSTTTSFTFTVNLKPGQFAQPVQVVQRQWRQGIFVGAFRSTGYLCDGRHPGIYSYWWDGEYRWGNWSLNERVSDYGTYNVWS